MARNLSNREVNFAPGLPCALGVISLCNMLWGSGKRNLCEASFLARGSRSFCLRLLYPADFREDVSYCSHILGSDLGPMTRPLGGPLLKHVVGISWENASEMFCSLPDAIQAPRPPWGGVGEGCVLPPREMPLPLRTRGLLVLCWERGLGSSPTPRRWCHPGAGR